MNIQYYKHVKYFYIDKKIQCNLKASVCVCMCCQLRTAYETFLAMLSIKNG